MIQVFVRVTSSYCSLSNLIFDAICLLNFEVIWVNTSQQVEHLDRHDMIHKKSQRQRRLYPRHAPKATIKTYMYDELLDKVQSSVEVSSQSKSGRFSVVFFPWFFLGATTNKRMDLSQTMIHTQSICGGHHC